MLRATPARRALSTASTLFLLGAVLFPCAALAQDALPFTQSYSITGNYVVGGVDLVPQSQANGFVTGTINMSGVPPNADILAAYLYWETIWTQPSQADGATFRGAAINAVAASSHQLTGATAPCMSSGGGAGGTYTMTMYRADVLRLLPLQLDEQGNPTGKRLVNNSDLLANQLPLHTVTLPEAGTGNQVPQSAGASLLIVYRDPLQPLTKVVVYDGIYVKAPGAGMSQQIRGFLESSPIKSARLTHIVGSGAPNGNEQLRFTGTGSSVLLAANPFSSASQSTSDRGWSNPTFDVSPQMPGVDSNDGFGEQVTTTVTHGNSSPYDCLSWAAIVFSTSLRDTDQDGLVDKLEDVSGLKDPNGTPLPDLRAMGAQSDHKDLFIEVDRMVAAPGTTYGSLAAPLNATTPSVTDPVGHDHMPTPAVLKMLGDAFANSPASNPDGVPGISVHFDVGPGYHAIGPAYQSAEADAYIIPPALARGGEAILETVCGPGAHRNAARGVPVS